MSFEIDWDKITNDPGLNSQLCFFLNTHLRDLELPSYLDQLTITKFSLGQVAPQITIRHVGDPFAEFYQDGSAQKQDTDIQFVVEFDFQSNLYLELETNLLLHYPSSNFISLPIKLKFTDLSIHSLASIAVIGKKSFVSFLCDVDDEVPLDVHDLHLQPMEIPNSRSNSYMGSLPLHGSRSFLNTSALNNNNTRIDIIKKLKIESELGESRDVDGSILRNIGKIEKFLIEMIKDLIITELAWPSWLELDFGDDDDDDDENDSDHSDTTVNV